MQINFYNTPNLALNISDSSIIHKQQQIPIHLQKSSSFTNQLLQNDFDWHHDKIKKGIFP